MVPPLPGTPVLLDPRVDDPAEFMELELRSTFLFLPSTEPGTVAHQRAAYTIEILGLNARDYLPVARGQAYRDYRSHLSCYVDAQRNGREPERLSQLEQDIRTRQHPTVWREMKRQHQRIPDLKRLFEAAPEALGW